MKIPIWKPYIDYITDKPLDLAEKLLLAGTGVASEPLFIDAPENGIALKAKGSAITTTHANAVGGGDKEQALFEVALAEGQLSMHNVAVYAGFKCGGNKELLIKIKVPFYDANTTGRSISTFTLENGRASGELVITVPIVRKDDSYIAIYSLDSEADIADYKLAGGNSHCKFSLFNLPVGTKVWVRWAILNAMGIGIFSAPYPIIVT